MDESVFKSFCADIGQLSIRQIREIGEMLRSLGARTEVLTKIDARYEVQDFCIHCHDTQIRPWGETSRGFKRSRCLACKRTFSSVSKSPLSHIRSPEKFHLMVEDMLSTTPNSCRDLAKKLDLDKMTIWRWRKRVIQALMGVGRTGFAGIVEADQKYFRESRKGSREWMNHQKYPNIFPKPNRLRWEDYKRLKIPMKPGLSQFQIPVLTIIDRSGARRADVLPGHAAPPLVAVLSKHIGLEAVLCSDADSAFDLFARQQGLTHYRLDASKGIRVIQKAFHIQATNNLHRRFKDFMTPFCGPATKNLAGYTAWFITRLLASNDAKRETWQRLLVV